MNYEKSPNESEILSADERRLSEICRTLKKVEAPQDFDFRLKARLAHSTPTDFQPRFGFAFRYALPALALIVVLGLLAYNGGFLSSSSNPLVVQSTGAPPNPAVSSLATAEDKQSENNVAAVSPKPVKTPGKSQPQFINAAKSTNKNSRKNPKDALISSKDFASTEDETKQPNFSGVIVPRNSPAAEKSNPISVREVLSIMGISADFENDKWTVRSVTANSVGENSGVKANDVIEAIDDQPLSSDTVFTKIVNGKTMTVTRKGEKSQLKLRAKQ